jgi:hypothetical protein
MKLFIAYSVVVLTAKIPWIMGAVGLILLVRFGRKGYGQLTAFGTARWADIDDLKEAGMLSEKPGLIIGRVYAARPQFLPALKALFNRKIPAAEACEKLVQASRKKPRNDTHLVRLSSSVHT